MRTNQNVCILGIDFFVKHGMTGCGKFDPQNYWVASMAIPVGKWVIFGRLLFLFFFPCR